MKRRLLLKVCAVIPLFLLVIPTWGGNLDRELFLSKSSLSGLKCVTLLVIAPDDASAKELGLTEDAVRTRVELRLRSAGIPVLTSQEVAAAKMADDAGLLTVNLTWKKMQEDLPLYYGNISFDITQAVILVRNSGILGFAKTWSDGGAVWFNEKSSRGVLDHIADFADRFANDYLKANPKETRAKPKP